MDNILGTFFGKLVLIIGVVAVMAIAYKTYQANSANTLISQLAQTSQGIQSLYSSSQFTTLSNTVVINGKLATDDMIANGGLVNPYNGTATFNVHAGNASQFDATETNVSSDGCSKVAQGMTYAAMTINGTAITMPADPGQVTAACAGGANSLVLTFSH